MRKKKSFKSTNKFLSRTPGYDIELRDAMPGDLVMAFVSDINHPAVDTGFIYYNYILVGTVKSFVYVEWNTGMEEDEWDGITNHGRLKILWSDIQDWDDSSCNQPEYALNSQVKVIALKSDGNLDGINPEIKPLIEDQFVFGRDG